MKTHVAVNVVVPLQKMALEIKMPQDGSVRSLGQFAEALAHGYKSAALVKTLRNVKRTKPETFDKLGPVLLDADSMGSVHQAYPTHA